MWKVLLGLLKGGEGRKSVAGGLAWEIREIGRASCRERV